MFRQITKFVTLFSILVAPSTNIVGQAVGKDDDSFLNASITLVQKNTRPELFLRTLSRRGNFPIGFYRAPSSKNAEKNVTTTIEIRQKSIREALDRFVALWPEYKWGLTGGVVNVTPIEQPSLLAVPVDEFEFKEKLLEELEFDVFNIPSIQRFLDSQQLRATQISIHYGPMKRDSRISIRLQSSNVLGVLNTIVTTHPNAHFWLVEEYGNDPKYIRLFFYTK
jgi:hypothetical protein